MLVLVPKWHEDWFLGTQSNSRKKQMETFLSKNWKTLLVLVGILFAIFVWPTLYKDLPMKGAYLQRQNRITGHVEICISGGLMDWR